MREVREVWVGCKSKEAVDEVLSSAGVNPSEGSRIDGLGAFQWHGTFGIDDPRWRVLSAKARAAGDDRPVVGRSEYTDGEIRAAELVLLETKPESVSRGDTGPDDGNEYDYSEACPVCLSGAKLISPFRISARDLPKRRLIAETFRREYLVSGQLAVELQKIPEAERWLVQVEDKKSRQPLSWLAIQPGAMLPRLHPSTQSFEQSTGRVSSCRRCQRDGWGGRTRHVDTEGVEIIDPTMLIFSRKEMMRACGNWIRGGESVPDAAGTWELHGVGGARADGRRIVPQPYILVSQRVASLLREHVGKWLNLLPVFLID